MYNISQASHSCRIFTPRMKPSRSQAEGKKRLDNDEDLQGVELILSLARDLGVNISGMAIILQMRERMEEMQRQIQEFVQYIQHEVLARASAAADPSKGAIVPLRRTVVPPADSSRRKDSSKYLRYKGSVPATPPALLLRSR